MGTCFSQLIMVAMAIVLYCPLQFGIIEKGIERQTVSIGTLREISGEVYAAPVDLFVTRSVKGNTVIFKCQYFNNQVIKNVYRIYENDGYIIVKAIGAEYAFVKGNVISYDVK